MLRNVASLSKWLLLGRPYQAAQQRWLQCVEFGLETRLRNYNVHVCERARTQTRTLCGSLWLSVALCCSPWLSVARCGSLLLSVVLCGSLYRFLWLSVAFFWSLLLSIAVCCYV